MYFNQQNFIFYSLNYIFAYKLVIEISSGKSFPLVNFLSNKIFQIFRISKIYMY